MSGRGRELTLPAWMTSAASTGSLENSSDAPSTAATMGQYDDQSAYLQTAGISQLQQYSAEQTNGHSAQETQQQHAATAPVAGQQYQAPAAAYVPAGQPPYGQPAVQAGYVPPYMPPGYPAAAGMPMPVGYAMPATGMGYYVPPTTAGIPYAFPGGMHPGYPGPMIPTSTPVLNRPVPGKPAANANPSGIQDSNNDASAWSEHITENDQRKYWYNKVTQKSTFDKPACLKTPEERSIPPCPWKEYATAEGKKYYHNGKDTVWDMPEEFREWSERVEAASKKRKVVIAEQEGSAAAAKSKQQRKATRDEEAAIAAASEPEVVYASHEEAVAAFKALLSDRGIPSAMKFKEVQEICCADKRWNALKSAGEKKQNLAEYQTKKAKAEKEEKREKGKKLRDAFLLMLAENTQIDANTRWRTAQGFLSSDNRYKAIEDDVDREDIFREFIQELDKKEREDADRVRREALDMFKAHLNELHKADKINYRSSWADSKPALSAALADVRYASISESDMRRALQDFVSELCLKFREELKIKREMQRAVCEEKEKLFCSMLRRLSTCEGDSSSAPPALTYLSEWKDVRDWVEATAEHADLKESYDALNVISAAYDKTDNIRGSASRARGRSRSVSVLKGGSNRKRSKSVKDVFDYFMADLEDEYKADKKVFKAAMADVGIKITYDSKCEDIMQTLKNAASVAGESGQPMRDILKWREFLVRMYVEDTIDFRIEDRIEAEKLELKFIELLEDYYYRSDHVGITWEEAKDDLYNRSAYNNLEKPDRKRIFDKYMADLADKLAAKKRHLNAEPSVAEGDLLSSSESSDYSSDGSGKHKKSKKEKKSKKKHSDHKKSKRIREDSDSPEEGEISTSRKSSRKY